MEFGSFDDDLFEEKDSTLKSNPAESNWTAHQSEPGWFCQVSEKISSDDSNSFNVKHLHANYLYSTGHYKEAAQVFRELLKMMANGNHQREVSEGLARCLLKTGEVDQSLEAAHQFELSCKSQAHYASYHSLCSEIYRKSLDPAKELFHLQQTIKIHPVNPNFWQRIAECYGLISQVDIYSLPCRLSQSKDTTWYAAAGLIRVDAILKSLIGKESFGALRKKRNQRLIDKIQPSITSLPSGFVSLVREHLCRDVCRPDLFQNQDDEEFVDLGSSKLAKSADCSEENSSATLGDDNQQDWFDKQWFGFFDSIQDINLYFVSSENTHRC